MKRYYLSLDNFAFEPLKYPKRRDFWPASESTAGAFSPPLAFTERSRSKGSGEVKSSTNNCELIQFQHNN